MKKNTNQPMEDQLYLFAQSRTDEVGDLAETVADESLLEDDFPAEEDSEDLGEAQNAAAVVSAPAAEPMFRALLRSAVLKQWGDDPVLMDFVEHVAGPLSDHLGHVAAKGGDFAAKKRAEAQQQGRPLDSVDRYGSDQSMRAHLVNGIFPVLHMARALQRWQAPQFRYYDDTVRRLFISAYVLHDWLKLPQVDTELEAAGLAHDRVNAVQHAAKVEAIFLRWGRQLGLDTFLNPIGGIEHNLHELIYLACNTQIKWGTLRNLAALPKLYMPGAQRDLAEQLCRLADYLAYLGRTPREAATHPSIVRELAILSDQRATLVFQHLAEVRGVLTNLIQNAALAACSSESCVPLLYSPKGIVYLVKANTFQAPEVPDIAERVVDRIRELSKRALATNLTGFGRDGKGMKYAKYYSLFFEPLEMLQIGLSATLKVIHPTKPPAAGKRYDKLANWMEVVVPRDVMDDVRVDQLAEWCFLAEKISRDVPGGDGAAAEMLRFLSLPDLTEQFGAVPRDSRAGGVGYHWYFAAAHYLRRNPGLDPFAWEEKIRALAAHLVQYLKASHPNPEPASSEDDGFADLREYVLHSLTFGPQPVAAEQDHAAAHKAELDHVLAPRLPCLAEQDHAAAHKAELHRYAAAKKAGKKEAMCSLCSSAFAVRKQEEAAVLFAPQVYSNKLVLHGSDALRNICSVCGLEVMLRQLLMNDSDSVGKNFEGRRLRYLYFYPTYFFSAETLVLFRDLQDTLKAVSMLELRRQLAGNAEDGSVVTLTSTRWQRLQDLLLAERRTPGGAKDRYLRMHFPETEPITFFFLGVPPPGRESKDAEAWVLPALLSLVLPLCLDVKVVASETSIPFISDADEFAETVFIDSAHAAVKYLLGHDHINLDHLLPLLNRLAVAYFIHIESNARMSAGKYDYRWQDLPELARRLSESSLYAFHYLKKWQRRAQRDSIPAQKAQLYMQYYQILASTNPSREGEDGMSHAQTLTQLYRRFYRARSRSSNSILRPISVAAHAVLLADRRIYVDAEGLAEIVRGELHGFVDRVASRRADGYVPRIEVDGKKVIDEPAIAQFADYFVKVLFFGALRGDASALRGRQLNLLKNACEVIYRDLDAQYWADQGKEEESALESLEPATESEP